MKGKCQKKYRISICLMIAVLLIFGSALSAGAATGKALRLRNAVFKEMNPEEGVGLRGAELGGSFLKNDKLKKTGMNFSATVYFPAKALKNEGDMVILDVYLNLQKTNAGNNSLIQAPREQWKGALGFAEPKFDFAISLNKNGTLDMSKHNIDTNRYSGVGKYLTVEKNGDYYVAKINKVPFTGKYYKYTAGKLDYTAINTKKSYRLTPTVLFLSFAKKGWRGNLYVDDLKLKSATKTQTITFDKKDNRGLYVSNWQNSNEQHFPQLRAPMN